MKLNSSLRFTFVSVVLTLAGAAFAAGCSSDSEALPTVDCTASVPTYSQVTLLTQVCTQCHSSTRTGADRSNAPVGINFDTYAAAKAHAETAVTEVYGGSMPPGNANAT